MATARKSSPIPSFQDRIHAGKSARARIRRQSLARFEADDRAFDPIDLLLKASADERVPALLPVKFQRMKASPFAFFRGSACIMAADLGAHPHSGIYAQLCGDAHLQNLGSFAAPDGRLVFDINDFDETVRGPWEWDVKRMAASVVLAGRESGHSDAACRRSAASFVENYCDFIARFSRMPILDAARYKVHRKEERAAPIHNALRQSQRTKPADLAAKFTARSPRTGLCFRNVKPEFWRVDGGEARSVLASLKPYMETLAPERRHLFTMYRPVDVGFKIVGTGSVGLRDYVVLMEGNGPEDLLFLQVKQEPKSAWTNAIPAACAQPRFATHGERVALGQRAIQPDSDPLLGWTRIGPHDYLVRQLNDHKGGVDLVSLRGTGLSALAELAGELLARGHARSGDACLIRGYCGAGPRMAKLLADFAVAYADQTEADYNTFISANRSGRVPTGSRRTPRQRAAAAGL